jgi:hypothetical protein
LLAAPVIPIVVLLATQPVASLSFLVYSYAVTLMVGLPMLLIYELLGWRRLFQYVLGGSAISFGVGVALMMTFPEHREAGLQGMMVRGIELAAFSAIASATFWFVAIRPLEVPADPAPR